ncbi:MAG: M28 family metallopeptidase [Hyphomonadaceae bacterium]|nr:M28 family metallopeptidase [Hyphomonadaceae bacterium]
MRTRVLAAAGLALALAGCGTFDAARTDAPAAVEAAPPGPPMSAAALAHHTRILSSDAFEGREPGTAGETKTTDYLVAAFKAAGLQPGWNGQWLQPTPLLEAAVQGAPALTVTAADGPKSYAYRTDQVVWTKRPQGAQSLADAPLVFVGYGVVAPEQGWNDYAGVDMAGKIAVILVNDPDFETPAGHPTHGKFGGKAMTYYGRWTYKFEEAGRQGAAGALIVHETGPAAYPWAVVESSWTGPQFDTKRQGDGSDRVQVEGWIQQAAAADILHRAGADFATLKAAAQRPGFRAVPIAAKGALTLATEIKETVSNNVVALLPGREAPDEAVLYGAHWDHLGRCTPVDGDDICNGALDNASGTSGLIELARRFAQEGPARRSVLFVAFTAEEQGLLGSAYYALNPAIPANRTVAAVNMDGAALNGATRDVIVVGYGKSEIEDLLARYAQAQGRAIKPEEFPERGSFYRSDHFNLAKAGIPVLYASGGIDLVNGGAARGAALQADYVARRYHKPQDEFDPAWDYTGQQQDLQLFYQVGRTYADGTQWPNWKPTAEFHAIREASRRTP